MNCACRSKLIGVYSTSFLSEPSVGVWWSLQESGDEIDAAVREVNKLLGETEGEGEEAGKKSEGAAGAGTSAAEDRSLLKVDRR